MTADPALAPPCLAFLLGGPGPVRKVSYIWAVAGRMQGSLDNADLCGASCLLRLSGPTLPRAGGLLVATCHSGVVPLWGLALHRKLLMHNAICYADTRSEAADAGAVR